MKQFFKKVLFCLIFTLIFYGCAEEKEFSKNNNNSSKVVMYKINYNDLIKNKNALNKFNVINEKSRISGRSIYDSVYNFYINTDNGLYIEKDGVESYTFPVYRDLDNQKLENLVLTSTADGNYNSSLIIYDVNEAEKLLIDEGIDVNLKDKTTVVDLDQNRIHPVYCTFVDIVVTQNPCSSGAHLYGDTSCDILNGSAPGTPASPNSLSLVVTQGACPTGSDGNPDNSTNPNEDNYQNPNVPDGSSSNNNGGLGASGNNPPLLTSPITCTRNCIEASLEQETLTPCEELLNLFKNNVVTDADTPQEHITENPDLEDEINHIKDYVDLNGKEHGYLLDFKNTIGADNNEIRDFNATYKVSENYFSIKWEFNENGYTYGIIHTHPKEGTPLPSFGDLNTLVDIYEQAKRYNKSKVVMIVIAIDPNNITGKAFYAVKIDDFETFKQFIKSQLLCDNADGTAQEPCTGKKLANRIRDIHNAESKLYGLEKYTHEKKFLERYNSAGISLYRANDALTNWRKLKIVGTTVDDSENCNN